MFKGQKNDTQHISFEYVAITAIRYGKQLLKMHNRQNGRWILDFYFCDLNSPKAIKLIRYLNMSRYLATRLRLWRLLMHTHTHTVRFERQQSFIKIFSKYDLREIHSKYTYIFVQYDHSVDASIQRKMKHH